MTPGVILTRVTVTATWHNDSLTRGNFFDFLKKIQKNKIIKKIQKNKIKNSKNRRIDT